MNDLVDTTEMYLKSVIELEEQGVVPLRARISERLNHSGPTVSQTVARMERDGLLSVSGDRHLELTAEGRRKAMAVMRKHRLAERLLSDVIGLDWELVHEEACRWEHVMSDKVEERLADLLPEQQTSPYGNPIPQKHSGSMSAATDSGIYPMDEACNKKTKITAVISWLSEPIQTDTWLLGQLKTVGVVPGAEVTITNDGDYLSVHPDGGEHVLDLPLETAAQIFVKTT